MSAPTWLGIALLGGAGAVGRALLTVAVDARTTGSPLPLGTLAVNISGSAILGLVIGAGLDGPALALVATGALGAYTTFSTWMVDSERLARGGARTAAACNVAASLAAGLAAVALGRAIGALL